MKVGISFDGFATLHDALDLAVEAERMGISSVWIADHLGYRDPLITASTIALRTSTLRLVPTAISPYLRHPTPTAMALASLAELAPGRIELAVGVGNPLFLRESGYEIVKPVGAIRSYVAALRALWREEAVTLDAPSFKLAGAKLAFGAGARIPIYLAPMREQMLKLAGAIGDGLVLSAGLSAGYVKASLDLAAAGGPDGVLDPARFNRAGYLYFLVAADEADARRKLRHKLAFVLRNKFLDDNVRHSGLPIDQAGIIDAIARRDIDAAAALVPEEAIDAFGIVGDVEKCRRRLREYLDAGLAEPVLSMTGDQADRRRSLAAVAAMMQTL